MSTFSACFVPSNKKGVIHHRGFVALSWTIDFCFFLDAVRLSDESVNFHALADTLFLTIFSLSFCNVRLERGGKKREQSRGHVDKRRRVL